jgi:hypothetical protein
MAALQSDIKLVIRPFSTEVEKAPVEAVAVSYDHRGVRYGWWPGINLPAAALDVELKDNRAGAFIRQRYASGDGNFLVRWTMTEVLAKLLDEPVVSLIKRCGLVRESFEWTNASAVLPQHARLEQEAVWLRAIELPDHWAAVGYVDNRK